MKRTLFTYIVLVVFLLLLILGSLEDVVPTNFFTASFVALFLYLFCIVPVVAKRKLLHAYIIIVVLIAGPIAFLYANNSKEIKYSPVSSKMEIESLEVNYSGGFLSMNSPLLEEVPKFLGEVAEGNEIRIKKIRIELEIKHSEEE